MVFNSAFKGLTPNYLRVDVAVSEPTKKMSMDSCYLMSQPLQRSIVILTGASDDLGFL
jgi:hypothetical protein